MKLVAVPTLLWNCPACGELRVKGWCGCLLPENSYCPDCGCTGAMLCWLTGTPPVLRCHKCGKDRPL